MPKTEIALFDQILQGSQLAIQRLEGALAQEKNIHRIRQWERQLASAEESLRKCRDGEVVTQRTQNVAARAGALCAWYGGQLLKSMEKRAGARDGKTDGHRDRPFTLQEQLGTESESQAHSISKRWQIIAEIPKKEFEQLTDIEQEKEITRASLIKRGKQIRNQKEKPGPNVHASGSANAFNAIEDVDGQQFACVYADPPWKYSNQGTRASTNNHYKTLTVEQLCAMPVEPIVSKDAFLHIWTTNAFLFDTKQVIESWGFEYRSCFVWAKTQIGLGNYWRVSHEFLLLAIRGQPKWRNKNLRSWMELKRGKHSFKPEEVRSMIESACDGPYVELFGRRPVEGWTVIGNQIENRLFA